MPLPDRFPINIIFPRKQIISVRLRCGRLFLVSGRENALECWRRGLSICPVVRRFPFSYILKVF